MLCEKLGAYILEICAHFLDQRIGDQVDHILDYVILLPFVPHLLIAVLNDELDEAEWMD